MTASIDNHGAIGNLLDSFASYLGRVIDKTDEQAAEERVRVLQESNPDATTDQLVSQLAWRKCLMAGGLGAITPGARLIGLPLNLGLLFKWQAELVLEIASLHGQVLDDEEKRNVVLVVTGVSLATSQMSRVLSRELEHVAGRALAESRTGIVAPPLVGSVVSASTNVLFTHLIAWRAHTYFEQKSQQLDEPLAGTLIDEPVGDA